jgi:hypothetical protein
VPELKCVLLITSDHSPVIRLVWGS